MKCLMLAWRPESSQLSHVLSICDCIFVLKPALSICSPSVMHWIPKLFIGPIHILFLLYLLLRFCCSTPKLAGFHQNY